MEDTVVGWVALGPLAQLVLLGVGKGGVLYVVVVVCEVGGVGRILLVEAHDAVGVATFVCLESSGVADGALVHTLYTHVIIGLVDGCLIETRGAVGGIDSHTAGLCVGCVAVSASGILEGETAGAYLGGYAVELHTCTEKVVGRHLRNKEYVAGVDAVAASLDETRSRLPYRHVRRSPVLRLS